MNKIEILRQYIDELLLDMTDVMERRCAYVHLYGVAQSCALIALKRGENVELATMAGMLHDIYTYAKMDRNDHAHKGAAMAREILQSLRLTSDTENDMVCHAIFVHMDKDIVNSDFDEVLKDADVFQHCLYNSTLEWLEPNHRRDRYEKLKREFGIA